MFTWLNPEYVMSLPNRILAYGQMTAFVQLSINYPNLTRSPLAEHYAEGSMKTILKCLRRSLADPNDVDARGTLLLNSALALSGINDLGREGEFAPYPLQSFAQRYIQSADTFAASSAVTTLLRCPGIRDGENETYALTKEGEKPSCWFVDRAAIAQCMADMIKDETLGANESLGITNGRA